jgi:hypothetical protein
VAVFHHIKLAADDRFEATPPGFRHEFEGPEHIAVVGEGYAFLSVARGLLHHGPDVAGAVKQGILRMAMQVYEILHLSMVNVLVELVVLLRESGSKIVQLPHFFQIHFSQQPNNLTTQEPFLLLMKT